MCISQRGELMLGSKGLKKFHENGRRIHHMEFGKTRLAGNLVLTSELKT